MSRFFKFIIIDTLFILMDASGAPVRPTLHVGELPDHELRVGRQDRPPPGREPGLFGPGHWRRQVPAQGHNY